MGGETRNLALDVVGGLAHGSDVGFDFHVGELLLGCSILAHLDKMRLPWNNLSSQTKELRADIIRMITAAGSGHPGGSLSVIDILTVLYAKHLRHDPKRPDWPGRDRLILSKGHACPALYAVMAHEGYFPKEELMTLRKLGSRLQGHPERHRLPGIEAATGSLGQGLSIGLGMALAAKLDGTDQRVYVVTRRRGDAGRPGLGSPDGGAASSSWTT